MDVCTVEIFLTLAIQVCISVDISFKIVQFTDSNESWRQSILRPAFAKALENKIITASSIFGTNLLHSTSLFLAKLD